MRYRIFLLFSALILLSVFLPAGEASAKKSYKMQNVSVVADLHSDGSMQVSESRTYKFRGTYKYAFRTFTLSSEIDYSDFRVSENNQSYVMSDNKEPGTFQVSTDDQEIEVRWYYRARRETRTFTIDYLVENAVKRYRDEAVLYYKFIGEGFRKSTENLDITVNPPRPVDQWNVRQWAHGPLWGSSATSAQGVVTATCSNLPRKQFFELRILYPAELFAEAVENSGYIASEVIAEETAWAEEANVRREEAAANAVKVEGRMKIGAWAMPLLLTVGVVWFGKISRQYGKRPDIPAIPSSSPEIPSDLPPALVSYLIAERSISGSAIMGTMLDLARRGFLEFKEEQELGKGFLGREKIKPAHFWVMKKDFFRENQHLLVPFEEMLIKFVFEKLVEGPEENASEVTVAMEAFKKNKSKVQTFFGKWSKEVIRAGEEQNFFDQESFKGRNQGMVVGGIVLVLAIALAFFFHQWALVPGIGGFVMIVSSLGIVHHTREGRIQEKRWKGLKKYLTSSGFKSSEPSGVLNSIESYFVYGVVLGMQKKHLASLGQMIPAERCTYFLPWYLYHREGAGFVGESFGASFSTAVASMNSAMSSSSGAGGGASGGGGGGAGGGGGGAG